MRNKMIAAVAAALVVAACDNGGSAVQTRERADAAGEGAASSPAAPAAAAQGATGAQLTANRRETADAKATRLFERNGPAFGAPTAAAYLAQAEAFTQNPPPDTETARRPNGDTLFYQASTNTFAVTDADGVLRTMFKPDDGPAYWAQQKERAPTFGQRRATAE